MKLSKVSAAVLATFAIGMASSALAQDKAVKIGFSLPTQLQPRWLFDAAAFEAQAKKNGDEVIIQYAEGDPSTQTQQVQNLLSRGIEVLVLAPTSTAVGGTIIQEAKASGVKVIVYDIAAEGAAADWMTIRNQERVPELQVEVAFKTAPKGNYVVLKGDAGFDLAQIAGRVYEEKLKGAADIKVVYNDFVKGWDPATAQKITEDVLTRNNDDVVAVLANNDGIATGAIQALRGAGLAGKTFVSGLDGDEANLHLIATGEQTMTVYTPVDVMAQKAADAAHKLGNGQAPETNDTFKTSAGDVPLYKIDLIAVTKDNLCEFVTKTAPKGWAKPEVVFKDTDIKCQ